MLSAVFISPQEGEVWFLGKKRPTMKPYQVARQGIARTFQNIALFEGMTVLDNIMTGRLNFHENRLAGAVCLAGESKKRGNDKPPEG